jgi:hypothetical protein
MVTLNPAEIFGIADRIGSIEPGKDADFLVLEGHPFEYNVLPQMVYIDGQRVHETPRVPAGAATQSAQGAGGGFWWFAGGLVAGTLLTGTVASRVGSRRRARWDLAPGRNRAS